MKIKIIVLCNCCSVLHIINTQLFLSLLICNLRGMVETGQQLLAVHLLRKVSAGA